ncbi:MAG: secondary thiamine-phosphate synthase enzyme YjbQ [Pseudomonadota bacterium]
MSGRRHHGLHTSKTDPHRSDRRPEKPNKSTLRRNMLQININTSGPRLYEITDECRAYARTRAKGDGVLSLLVQHTSASLLIQENADPSASRDLIAYFERLAPPSSQYEHAAEGPDDMPAHLKAALTATSLSIPVIDGAIALGTWQGIFLFEHRRAPQRRAIVGVLTPAL